MTRVGVVGATGYTGVELIRLISRHPRVRLTALTAERNVGQPIWKLFPSVLKLTDLVCGPLDVNAVSQACEFVFLALPHKAAMEVAPAFVDKGMKVVDLSADFRLNDPAVYEEWYEPHSAPSLLKEAVYGIPELHREEIKKARLVANPGCYPTSVILALAPALKRGLIDLRTIIADSKSGVSGAGRSAVVSSLYAEVSENFKAYKVTEHRHTPEIEQELSRAAGEKVNLTFTPHLTPMKRGILSTIYATLKKPIAEQELQSIYSEFYGREKFIRLRPPDLLPGTADVFGSNYCDIGMRIDKRFDRLILLSAIDNLVKGASGQAVQNMNLMLGFEESAGLDIVPVYP
ncbi:MAG TPA: N-acetyl-gamma-glutamyl-phosphate reductase [Thermodesulfobacteriota bacterium]|nr:N-acetyl-gamma-glutamyl-phosphate reductase [Thermodesulfobacteriota bacterium]